MALGRGSAMVVAMTLSLCLLLQSEMADAASYTVGDANGWTFNAVGWPKGKRFRAGDTLGLYLNLDSSLFFYSFILERKLNT